MGFNWFGVKIRVSFLFFALITGLLITDKTGIMPAVFVAFALHEAGHLIFIIRDKNVGAVEFSVAGITIRQKRAIHHYPREILTLIAGPAANLLLALICWAVNLKMQNDYITLSLYINLGLALFNLMPMASLDGRQILYKLMCLCMSEQRAFRVCSGISFTLLIVCMGLGAWLFAKFKYNPTLLITSLYMFILEIAFGPPGLDYFRQKG